MDHLIAAPLFALSIIGLYALYAWLLRRLVDPGDSFRELPMPWPLRLAALFLAVLTSAVVPASLLGVLHGLAWLLV